MKTPRHDYIMYILKYIEVDDQGHLFIRLLLCKVKKAIGVFVLHYCFDLRLRAEGLRDSGSRNCI